MCGSPLAHELAVGLLASLAQIYVPRWDGLVSALVFLESVLLGNIRISGTLVRTHRHAFYLIILSSNDLVDYCFSFGTSLSQPVEEVLLHPSMLRTDLLAFERMPVLIHVEISPIDW